MPDSVQVDPSNVPLVDLSGNVVGVDPADAGTYRMKGFTDPTPDQLAAAVKSAKFGTTGQQIITGLEHAGSALTFGGSTLAERALGVPAEDIAARSAENPVSGGIGTALGIAAPIIASGGLAAAPEAGAVAAGEGAGTVARLAGATAPALISRAGRAAEALVPEAAEGAGLGARVLSSVGKKALGSAIEGAAYGAGDVVNEAALGDPNLNGETAFAHIASSGLIGGALGVGMGIGNEVVPAIVQKATNTIRRAAVAMNDWLPGAMDKLGFADRGLVEELQKSHEMVQLTGKLDPQQFGQDLEDISSHIQDAEEKYANMKRRVYSLKLDPSKKEFWAAQENLVDRGILTSSEDGSVKIDHEALADALRNPASSATAIGNYIGTGGEYANELGKSHIPAYDKEALQDLVKKSKFQLGMAGNEARLEDLASQTSTTMTSPEGFGGMELLGAEYLHSIPGVHLIPGASALLGAVGAVKAVKAGIAGISDVPANVEALSKLERIAQKFSNSIDNGAGALVRGAESAGNIGRGEIAAGLASHFGKDEEASQRQFVRRSEKITQLATNVDALHQHVMDSTGNWEEHAPNTAQVAQTTNVRAITFLHDKNPLLNQPPNAFGDKVVPSATDIATYNRYYDAVRNPTSVLRQAAAGTLTAEAVEAVRTVYPALYAKMAQAVMEKVADKQGKVPYNSRNMISLFMGEPVSPFVSPQNVAMIQSVYASKSAQSQATGGAPAPRGKVPTTAHLDQSNRLSLRGERRNR